MNDRVNRIRGSFLRGAGMKGHPAFLPTCPNPDCGVKNWPDARRCSECATHLYPTPAALEAAKGV